MRTATTCAVAERFRAGTEDVPGSVRGDVFEEQAPEKPNANRRIEGDFLQQGEGAIARVGEHLARLSARSHDPQRIELSNKAPPAVPTCEQGSLCSSDCKFDESGKAFPLGCIHWRPKIPRIG